MHGMLDGVVEGIVIAAGVIAVFMFGIGLGIGWLVFG